MPIALIKSVRKVSSEDSVHVAANLLSTEGNKKWKTKSCGEKSAYVILELEEPHEITGIDIGNEHSAFVEVLVGKAGNSADDFTEILITCSFMTPIESKNSTNTNRVRCFGQNALVESKLSTKWHLIKVFCTQPFNKHVQFGLSFIKVHVTENAHKTNTVPKTLVPEQFKRSGSTQQNHSKEEAKKLKFSLREDSPESDSESASGLFSRWKMTRKKRGDGSLSIASAIREASNEDSLRRLSDSALKPKKDLKNPCTSNHREHRPIDTHIRDRNRQELLFGNEDQSEKLTKKNQKEALIQRCKKNGEMQDSGEVFEYNKVKTKQLENLKPKFDGKIEKNMKFRPFNKLLEGVVLVISGIQNPSRADLRNKALAMGAKYKGDWERGCTHLICAFKNTPKYNQVRGKGKIVTSKWIERCYESKKYLPWRRFALDSEEFDKPESDEERFDESVRKVSSDQDQRDDQALTIDYLEETNGTKLQVEVLGSSSENDTDDDIEQAISTNHQRNVLKQKPDISPNKNEVTKQRDIYEVLTEEEDFLKDKYRSIPKPNI